MPTQHKTSPCKAFLWRNVAEGDVIVSLAVQVTSRSKAMRS